MGHRIVEQVLDRADLAKDESDFTYFSDLLLAAEAIAKIIIIGMSTAIANDKDRNRYRIEHSLVRATGLGDWSRAAEDILSGPASQYLLTEAYSEQAQLTQLKRVGDWQHDAVTALKEALHHLSIESEDVPVKTDMKRWFRLLAVLRNKTRGHGAPKASDISAPAAAIERSIRAVFTNYSLMDRDWAYLYRNLSGKYRVSAIAGTCESFEYLKKEANHQFENGIYVWWDAPQPTKLVQGGPEMTDFYIANGGYGGRKYELLSYYSGDRVEGEAGDFSTPPGTLPASQTKGKSELAVRENCLTNSPDSLKDYVGRPELEDELLGLLLDDRRHIITLRGKGGIGKTSLALRVLEDVYGRKRYMTVIWLSARDVDLQASGPKPVRPDVVTPKDIGNLYASLVESSDRLAEKDFDAQQYFEKHLETSESGPCLFVLDNFETIQNPLDVFAWIDTYIRLPNKILITTRLRDFKGDYPVDVSGMTDVEARELVMQTAKYHGIDDILTPSYIDEVIHRSEGHPYIIKILLGEVSSTGRISSVPHIVAGSVDILTALFERTYAALSPCAQRAFLTLSAWSSSVPRLALEAVLLRSIEERQEVEAGVEMLIQYSLADVHLAPSDGQEFLALPLVASTFGKKKLNISTYKTAITSDVELLRLLGPSRKDDIRLGLARKLETFITGIADKVDAGTPFEEFEPVLEMICRNYPPGWLLLARWYLEASDQVSLAKAKDVLRKFLETGPDAHDAADAWRSLAYACHLSGDTLGEVHAFIERAQLADVPFSDVSNTANALNAYIKGKAGNINREEKQALALRLFSVLESRAKEANANDLSRMAWMAIHLDQEAKAQKFVRMGLEQDPENDHCQRLAGKLGVSSSI